MEPVDNPVSRAFRDAFETHPMRAFDPAMAVDTAREIAAELVPDGVTGDFDDENLTFVPDTSSHEGPCDCWACAILMVRYREESQ